MSPGPEYVALIQSADGVDHYPLDDRVESPFERRDSPLSNPEKRRSTSDSFLPTILYVSTFLVSALSLFFSVTNLTHFPSNTGFFYSKGSEDVRVIDVKSLRRPSLYMGLEKVPDVQLLEGGHHHEGEDEANEVYVPFPGGPQEVARISSRFPLFPSRPDGWVLLTEEVLSFFTFFLASPHLTRSKIDIHSY